jgi:hypothetical protein
MSKKYRVNMELSPDQATSLSKGGAISVNPSSMRRANVNVVLDEKNAKKLYNAYNKGGATKLKLTATEMEDNMNNKTRGGLGPLAMLAASSLIPAVAPAVGNLANNLFGKLFGGGTYMMEQPKRRKAGRRRLM